MNMILPTRTRNRQQAGLRVSQAQPLLEYQPKFDMDMVQRLLGRRKKRNLTRTTQRRLETYYQPVVKRLKPRVTWKVFNIANISDEGIELENCTRLHSRKMARTFKGARKAVCFVATVGPAIDRMIDTFVDKGSVADAYVIDALGSAAVEQTASSFQSDFAGSHTGHRCVAGLRFSPGYCDWHIREQDKLFSLLDCSDIGVTLSDTALMEPRKTVSAVFGLFDGIPASNQRPVNPCGMCAKTDCIARRTEDDTPHIHT